MVKPGIESGCLSPYAHYCAAMPFSMALWHKTIPIPFRASPQPLQVSMVWKVLMTKCLHIKVKRKPHSLSITQTLSHGSKKYLEGYYLGIAISCIIAWWVLPASSMLAVDTFICRHPQRDVAPEGVKSTRIGRCTLTKHIQNMFIYILAFLNGTHKPEILAASK